MHLSSVEDPSAAALVRLIRRICLLREQGDLAGAQDLEHGPLGAAVATARAQLGADALSEDELGRLFVRESERAAEAVAVAELIIQQLTPHWPATAPAAAAGGAAARRAPRLPARSAQPAGAPAIPDLLDAMLAHESQARRA